MIKTLLADTSFAGLRKRIDEAETRSSRPGTPTGAMLKVDELGLKYLSRTYREAINGRASRVNSRIQTVDGCKGDFKKINKDVYTVTKFFRDVATDVMKEYKGNKNISQYSILRMYCDAFDALHSEGSTFQKAYSGFASAKPGDESLTYEYVNICFLVLAVFVIDLSFRLHLVTGVPAGGVENEKRMETLLESIARANKEFIVNVGFACIDICAFVHKNHGLTTLLTGGAKAEAEARKRMAANGRESFTQVAYDLKMVYSSELARSNEFLVPLLIVGAVIVGALVSINLIRRALYHIAAIRIDIVRDIIREKEFLLIHIAELEDAAARASPKDQKRLNDIVKKQREWLNTFDNWSKAVAGDDIESYHEAESRTTSEDDQIKESSKSGASDDDYDIVL